MDNQSLRFSVVGGDGLRTADPLGVNEMLYQLS